jgi:hypothetical protein
VSFLRRLFSAHYRAAVAAEAGGRVDVAAERYGLAGDRAGAVRMHLARAARASDRHGELAALRDALQWAGDDPPLQRQSSAALGRALFESARAEGIATERDRARVREAAELLAAGGDHALAGEALEAIGDHLAAASAYSAGGLVERMEGALAKEDDAAERARAESNAFADYQTAMRVGRRDDARAHLVAAIGAARAAADLRRLLDQLDAALLTADRVELRRRNRPAIIACAADRIVIGRDPLCDLTLRSGGVSRQHAEIARDAAGALSVRDLGSRNGIQLRGLPLAGRVPLAGAGRLTLGEDCAIDYEVRGSALLLQLGSGIDRGLALLADRPGERLELAPLGVALEVVFQGGRPLLGRGACRAVVFNDEPLGDLRVQLIRGDRVVADDEELEVS